jgi:hypothetical protein
MKSHKKPLMTAVLQPRFWTEYLINPTVCPNSTSFIIRMQHPIKCKLTVSTCHPLDWFNTPSIFETLMAWMSRNLGSRRASCCSMRCRACGSRLDYIRQRLVTMGMWMPCWASSLCCGMPDRTHRMVMTICWWLLWGSDSRTPFHRVLRELLSW